MARDVTDEHAAQRAHRAVSEIVAALAPLQPAERERVLAAAVLILGVRKIDDMFPRGES